MSLALKGDTRGGRLVGEREVDALGVLAREEVQRE